jgi:hypothetical protein
MSQRFVYSPGFGRQIEVGEDLGVDIKPGKRRAEPKFVQMSKYWMDQLEEARNLATYRLALRILRMDYRRKKYSDEEIVLSAEHTGINNGDARRKAARELVRLGLIEVAQRHKAAARVTRLVRAI